MRANKTLQMVISPVTANEYAAGIRNEREARRFLLRFRMIALGRDVAFVVSRLDREQSATGLRLGENDTWQAAVALHFDLTLITADSDFDKTPQVKRRTYLP